MHNAQYTLYIMYTTIVYSIHITQCAMYNETRTMYIQCVNKIEGAKYTHYYAQCTVHTVYHVYCNWTEHTHYSMCNAQ